MSYIKKSLGQHFLNDRSVIDKIVGLNFNFNSILEIGGGTGNLSRVILSYNPKKFLIVEKDRNLIDSLKLLAKEDSGFLVIEGDFLFLDINTLITNKTSVIANLPYNLSIPILFKLLDYIGLFDKLILMFQKEVANRIVATPNNKNYGIISVIIDLWCERKFEFEVLSKAFFPPPKVTSAVVSLVPRPKIKVDVNVDILKKLLKLSFGQRRKQLKNCLKFYMPDICDIMQSCNIAQNARAENLTTEQFCMLSKHYAKII